MSEIRKKIIQESVSKAQDSIHQSQIATVIHYHEDNERCFCDFHMGKKIPIEIRNTADIQMNHREKKEMYYSVNCFIQSSNIIDQSLKKGDRVIVHFMNGDLASPYIAGVFRSMKENQFYKNKMKFAMPSLFNEMG
jgi:predicted metallo-beta-lactamase superfamily hydrolase